MECGRGPGYWGPGSLRIVHDEWALRKSQVPEKLYYPQFPQWARKAIKSGHGGGDFFTNYHFAQAIRTGKQPYLNVYRGVAMSCVGILAWKSVLDKGNSYEVPDFSRESSRKKWANDAWRPMDLDDPKAPPISSRGRDRGLLPEGVKRARRVWKKIGFNE